MAKLKRIPLLGIPTLDSYRGRYLSLATVIILILLTAGALGHHHVAKVSAAQLEMIQVRARATAIVHDTLEHLSRLQNHLHRYLINPPQISAGELESSLLRLSSSMLLLEHTDWVKGESELSLLAKEAINDIQRLQGIFDKLIDLRQSRGRWFPTLGAIEKEMLPNNLAVQALLSDMLSEEQSNLDLFEHDGHEHYLMLARLHSNWLRATAELRLLIANRFGIFSNDAMRGIASRADNIRIFLESIDKDLEALQQANEHDQLGLIASANLDELIDHITRWKQAYGRVNKNISADSWRADLSYTTEAIEPALNTLHHRLSGIRLELDIQSAQNITELTDVSQQLAKFTVLLAVAGSLLLLLAYWMFSRVLLRPIQQTTLALKQEAQGEPDISPPKVHVRETRDLVAAFEEMRQQVRVRQGHLDHLAHHDSLTGLPNRLLFRDRLEHALALSQRDQHMLGIMFLDLDRFKQINDSLGHAAGDLLLKQVAQRLASVMRSSDTIARLGGDEFAILAEQLGHRDEITLLAEKVLNALVPPFELEGKLLHVSTSIGIALSPDDDTDPDRLIRGADTAMYEAKQSGKACFRFFTPDMTQRATEYLELETSLRLAIADQGFELYFQPITTRDGSKIHGCEALMRWNHPQQGFIPPTRFIPMLDAMGQIGQVSKWILDSIARQQEKIRQLTGESISISINLTARLLHDDHFSKHLLERLANNSPNPQHLIVEVTEDSLTQDLDAAERVLYQLKELGVRTALDDFGTGQSSLNHLRHFPFDLVKIDREFIRDIPEDPHDVNLVSAIIQLSHAFGMEVVAEGMETEDQEQFLRAMGCDYLQGYLISRPIPGAALEDFIEQFQRPGARQIG